MKEPRVSIIIVHYGSLASTTKCLASLEKLSFAPNADKIVIDNAAKEPAAELEKRFSNTTVIRLDENTGFSGGNNAGIRFALKQKTPEMIVLLNDDTTVAPDFLRALWQSLVDRQRAAAVTPKIYFSAGREFHAQSYERKELGNVLWYAGGWLDWREVVAWHRGVDEVDNGQHDIATRIPFASGCCLALRPQALQEVGFLDDNLFLYWEDVELSLRLKKAGWELWYEPASTIWHDNAGSSGSGSKLHEYYQTRNRLIVGFAYAPLRTKIFLLKHMFLELRTGSSVRKQAILDFIQRKYGKQTALH
jgi:GT2 family glycosyltransferase